VLSEDIYVAQGPLGLKSVMELYDEDRPDLKDPPFVPATPTALSGTQSIFAAIREGDILLHHPFDSFNPVIELLETAARDPQVLAIKQTLYRTGRNSPIVRALMRAREEGKQVAALVELKARFDEENNIGWARALESTGAHVVYGMHGLKVHAKLLLIVRREMDGIRRDVHLSTGNYNSSTSRTYTDFGILTCDPAIGADVSELFNVLTGASDQTTYRNLLVAPHVLHQALLEKIEREIERHRQQGNGHLIFKCNSITDQEQIAALYRAAQAGVKVELIVRGICAIRPGIPGVSETLSVRSIVGRFLEHHRLYYFYNGGNEEFYLGSADLMERNLHHRIEQLMLVRDGAMRRYLRDTVLDLYLRDNVQAHELQSDGTYVRVDAGDAEPISAQAQLLPLSSQSTRHVSAR
jgi:polyphosphate kinase